MAGKRELIAPKGDKRLVRRDDKGRIAESDDREWVDAEDWCIGFLQAVALDTDAWAPLFDDAELGSALVPLALAAAQQAVYQQAQQHFRSGRRAAAYGRFAALAEAGHAPSAQIALLMQRQGLELFGTAWDAIKEAAAKPVRFF